MPHQEPQVPPWGHWPKFPPPSNNPSLPRYGSDRLHRSKVQGQRRTTTKHGDTVIVTVLEYKKSQGWSCCSMENENTSRSDPKRSYSVVSSVVHVVNSPRKRKNHIFLAEIAWISNATVRIFSCFYTVVCLVGVSRRVGATTRPWVSTCDATKFQGCSA